MVLGTDWGEWFYKEHTYTHIYTYIHIHTPTYIHTYTHTHTYIHTHTHIYTYLHTYTHTYIIHTYTYTHMYIYIHTHAHTYIHIHARTYTHIHTYIHTHIHTHIHIHTYTYVHTYIHTHIHTHLHTYTHTHTRTYIHTYTHNGQKSKVMLTTRRKRKERKELEIYVNSKPLLQVHSLKYLGIIFDSKLTFREHINYMAEKCIKLIFALSKSAKLIWGLNHATLKTIYTEGILPLLLYGAPVWKKGHR